MNWYLRVLRQYAVFRGRARRREYWWFLLFHVLFSIGLTMLDWWRWGHFEGDFVERMEEFEPRLGIAHLYGFVTMLPGIGVAIRRLHDTNRRGWWLMLALGPQIVSVLLGLVAGQKFDEPMQSGSPLFMGITIVLGMLFLVGGLVLLVLFCLDGTRGPNRFGPDPKGRGEGSVEVWPDVQ